MDCFKEMANLLKISGWRFDERQNTFVNKVNHLQQIRTLVFALQMAVDLLKARKPHNGEDPRVENTVKILNNALMEVAENV